MFKSNYLLCVLVTAYFLTGATHATRLFNYSLVSSCSSTEYFSSYELRCVTCGENKIKNPDDGASCVCQSGYRKNERDTRGGFTCLLCPEGQSVSVDGWSCVNCANGSDPVEKKCPTCDRLSATAERRLDGAENPTVECVACVDGTFATGDAHSCTACHDLLSSVKPFNQNITSCACNSSVSGTVSLRELGGFCFAVSGSSAGASVGEPVNVDGIDTNFFQNLVGGSVQSHFLHEQLVPAYAQCAKFGNASACQLLGSACALRLYNRGASRDACVLFDEIFDSADGGVNGIDEWKKGLPWLEHASDEILRSEAVDLTVVAGRRIEFLAAAFSPTGDFLGYRQAADGLLQLCSDTLSRLNAAYAAGTRYTSRCRLRVSDFFDPEKYPLVFYDLYLLVGSRLFPVPVKIESDQAASSGLKRRFFLVDNLGAVTQPGARAQIARFASSLRFDVALFDNGRIHPPLLTIGYTAVKFDEVTSSTFQEVAFEVAYEDNSGGPGFWEVLRIFMGVAGGLACLHGLFRAFALYGRSGRQNLEMTLIVHFLGFTASGLANLFFFVVFGYGLYYLVVYKNQTIFRVLIPTAVQEQNLTVYIVIAGMLKLIEIIYLLVIQSRVDIFLMDWEKPKYYGNSLLGGSDAKKPSEVTYWRTILVANEWNEIQTHRKTNRTFTLLVVLFFMNVLGFENYASGDPRVELDPSLTDEYRSSSVSIFRFAIAVSVFIGAGGVQWLWTLLVHERFIEDKLRNFVDLCSICNISVFIRYPRAFGYYIHGESPHSTADVGVSELHKQFEKEKSGQCDRRGLDNTDNQTFMMRLPPNFLTVFDGLNRRLVETASSSATGTPDAIYKYHEMNKFLTDFIHRKDNMRVGDANDARRVETFEVKRRKFIEDAVGIEIGNNEELQRGGILYIEDGTSFGDVLFYGNELSLMVFDILVFACVDLLRGSTALSLIATWLIGELTDFLRHRYGEINLSKKTLTSRQFLI